MRSLLRVHLTRSATRRLSSRELLRLVSLVRLRCKPRGGVLPRRMRSEEPQGIEPLEEGSSCDRASSLSRHIHSLQLQPNRFRIDLENLILVICGRKDAVHFLEDRCDKGELSTSISLSCLP